MKLDDFIEISFNLLALVGAVVGVLYGFTNAGLGGAIVGIICGGIVGILIAILFSGIIAVVTDEAFQIFMMLIVGLGLLGVLISLLWDVGIP